MLLVLAAQVVCLAAFSFAANLLSHDKWMSLHARLQPAVRADSVAGLFLAHGVESRDDIDLWTFFNTNPVESAVAIATAGEVIAILMMGPST